ncbi:MAG: S-methyl-5'-thioadenosine phosphorylase [Deltaproteobacteria bacterium]|nr:S-methyl-5'-thioadenosine phosphorylase [Deltaproteobacteria bacterium]
MSGAIAIIGGSGFYDLPGVEPLATHEASTPFGAPSAPIVEAQLAGRRVLFLARHGRPHRLIPSEVNARANLFALKRLGATTVLSVSAVGSLREAIAPGDVVVPRQFLDRTSGRPRTFYGDGVVVHISFAEPVCPRTAEALVTAARASDATVHPAGTYACIDGPRFSTRAESRALRAMGADVVGMTNLPEAALAREAELCWATLTLPTDHDAWRDDAEVKVIDVISILQANVVRARGIVATAIQAIDPDAPCACQRSLDDALFTPPDAIDESTRTRLAPLLARRLGNGATT